MSTREGRSVRLEELDRKIASARGDAKPEKTNGSEKYHAMHLAWRMVLELVIGMMIGLAMGWGLDSVFGTLPLFLIIMGLFGFGAGIRTMMRSAKEIERKQAEADAKRSEAGKD